MSMEASENSGPVEDHRVRVARERRVRTQARLLDTILTTYRGDQDRGPAVLDEILALAKISKTNFYKYFPSLDAAVRKLGEQLSNEMTETIQAVYRDVTNPLDRLAIGFQLFLSRASIDPRWGNFVCHGAYLYTDHQLMLRIREDFLVAVRNGDFRIDEIDSAVDLTIGTMIEGMRRVISSSPSRAYIEALSIMVLRGLGVPTRRAEASIRRASADLHRDGNELFLWWKPF